MHHNSYESIPQNAIFKLVNTKEVKEDTGRFNQKLLEEKERCKSNSKLGPIDTQVHRLTSPLLSELALLGLAPNEESNDHDDNKDNNRDNYGGGDHHGLAFRVALSRGEALGVIADRFVVEMVETLRGEVMDGLHHFVLRVETGRMRTSSYSHDTHGVTVPRFVPGSSETSFDLMKLGRSADRNREEQRLAFSWPLYSGKSLMSAPFYR